MQSKSNTYIAFELWKMLWNTKIALKVESERQMSPTLWSLLQAPWHIFLPSAVNIKSLIYKRTTKLNRSIVQLVGQTGSRWASNQILDWISTVSLKSLLMHQFFTGKMCETNNIRYWNAEAHPTVNVCQIAKSKWWCDASWPLVLSLSHANKAETYTPLATYWQAVKRS